VSAARNNAGPRDESATSIRIEHAESGPMLAIARELFVEYVHSLSFSLDYQGIDDELAALPGKYAPPHGCILVATLRDQPIGCIALRAIEPMAWDTIIERGTPRPARVCEMKRMYVRPVARRLGAGRILADELVAFATRADYDLMKLDTESTFTAAVALYQSLGFTPCPRYNDDPQPDTIWMSRLLRAR